MRYFNVNISQVHFTIIYQETGGKCELSTDMKDQSQV